jgi:pimeloyl-ACP methyl ester carboxylesterase
MTARSAFVDNAGVRLHALDSGARDGGRAALLVIPGMGEAAEEYAWLLEACNERRVVAVDVRGRGRSDAPPNGYRWEDHYGDVAAVVAELGVDRPIVVAFSRGSSYALGYSLSAPAAVRGLVIGDYWARHVGLPAEMADRQLATVLRGVPMSERMPEHAVRGVVEESVEVPLWGRLGELECPVLVIRGGKRGGLVNDDVAAQWQAALPSVELAVLPEAGHDLWSYDRDAYLAVLRPFLRQVERVDSQP